MSRLRSEESVVTKRRLRFCPRCGRGFTISPQWDGFICRECWEVQEATKEERRRLDVMHHRTNLFVLCAFGLLAGVLYAVLRHFFPRWVP